MSLQDKEWANIPGFPNYLISNEGDVMNAKTHELLNPSKDASGRRKVNLSRNGVVTTKYVNRLVAQMFHLDYHPEKTVRYKDENFENNHIDNLTMDNKRNPTTRRRDPLKV